ncbi:MAG: hypothetical protein NWR76_04655 [Opitutales bacterium]|jgi:tRNA threonylcarbamoyladenosine biosynthesis protein TsaB|nr:hypothetical protein [Opitutales bacterium]MDP4884715.1 hypothetical protein [Opitutales bacterium]
MDTIPNIPEAHYPALAIDGSGSEVYAGILGADGQWLAQSSQTGAPLEMLFPTVEATLKEAGLSLTDLRSYIYCEGPGSVLGLRLCAMAIETWSRLNPQSAHCYAYNTLQLCATLLLKDETLPKRTLLVSDWKKGAWNAVSLTDGEIGDTSVADDTTIAEWEGAVYHLPQRKGWQKPPANAISLSYTPGRLNELLQSHNFLRPTKGVELYASGVNTFAKWTPDRHRA